MSNQDSTLSVPEIKLLQSKKESVRIAKLGNRASRCICKYCGSSLSLRKVTYAAYDEAKIDIYCDNCQRFENGTEPLIYKMAEYFTEEVQFDYYPELDQSLSKHRMNVAVVSNIIAWGFQNAGLLDETGFTVELDVDPKVLGESLLLSKTQVEALPKEE